VFLKQKNVAVENINDCYLLSVNRLDNNVKVLNIKSFMNLMLLTLRNQSCSLVIGFMSYS